ncbi:MAG: hypothetical protein WCI11_04290 [Candidatus Methylumidiphilus sp.]
MADYTSEEQALDLPVTNSIEPETIFDLRPPEMPVGAVPVFDDELCAVVGYRHECTTGVYRLYDLEGKIIGMEEKGLETPLFDPLDLIFFAGGIFRGIGKGVVTGTVRTAPKVAALTATRLSARVLAISVVGAMRTAFKGLSVRSLKFTATTSLRMVTKGRYVPQHILHLAIKYGKRAADPQGIKGAFLYTTKMFRNGTEYTLEVVVRESDWTIFHFLYK